MSIYLLVLKSNLFVQVDWLTEKMRKVNFTVASMHGEMPQDERDAIMASFRSGEKFALPIVAVNNFP